MRLPGIFNSRSDLDHPFIATVVLVLAAFGIRLLLDPFLEERSPLLLFTAAVVIAAGRYGFVPGLTTAILGLALGTLVFMGPGFPPDLSTDDVASIGAYGIVVAAMLTFAGHMNAARQREEQLQAALHQVQTETAMSAMAAALAHELNQPLAAASNYVGACKRLAAGLDGEAQPDLVSGLTEAEAQIQRTGSIIRHARDLVGNVSAERQSVSLRKMVAEAMKPLRATGVSERMRLEVTAEPEAEELFVNAVQIEQVLLNLIRNACQAAGPDAAPQIRISATAQGRMATVEVHDDGPGISEEKMAALFTPGVGPSNGGLGLGLSICRTIVQAHGGRMWAENHADGGASFYFTVPRKEAAS